ncbi:SET domain-containing protein [Melanogaster broomeanus]|nr:SET domain-containing protein [Melanogaster broomeanus]
MDDAHELQIFPRSTSEPDLTTTDLAQLVLSQVQTEFTRWNSAYCRQTLQSLRSVSSNSPPFLDSDPFCSPSTSSIATSIDSRSDARQVSEAASTPLPQVVQRTYSVCGAVTEELSTQLEVVHLAPSMDPHPPYEDCSPLPRNIFKGDDNDNMNFIPFADDPSFDQIDHTYCYESFSWHDDFDPDLEIIVLEAAYRLHTQHALTYDELEDSNVLPLRLRPQFNEVGLLSTSRRRDRLKWSGNTIPSSYIFPSRTQPANLDLRHRLESANSLFCPNLNCVEPLCSLHVELSSMPFPKKSRFPLSQILGQAIASCRNECFLDTQGEQGRPLWDAGEIDMFKVIFEICPDMTPCELAELCLKPCREVLYYRNLVYPDNSEDIQPVDIKGKRRALNFNVLSEDICQQCGISNDPCHHVGPCDSSSDCRCFRNKSHCQRNCHCQIECIRRWQGCRCPKASSIMTCVTESCACVEAMRECDPQLCLSCGCNMFTIRRDENTTCRNSQVQRAMGKELEVKKSSWGLGAFLVEPVKAGDLISSSFTPTIDAEYNGELIYEPTVESRGELADHRNRCYVFNLNDTFSLDATYVGNVSRFIDHYADAEQREGVNCQALIRLVNGDHRIGIFALQDLEAGTEVLINYGSMFFTKHSLQDQTAA